MVQKEKCWRQISRQSCRARSWNWLTLISRMLRMHAPQLLHESIGGGDFAIRRMTRRECRPAALQDHLYSDLFEDLSANGSSSGNCQCRPATISPEMSAVRFYVLLKGEGFTSHLGAVSPSVYGQPKKFGFLATQVVEAHDAQRAIELATAQVYQDERIRDSSTAGIITPEEVDCVSWFFRRLRPPRGFTFVLEATDPDQ
jgi:hypothetical protein